MKVPIFNHMSVELFSLHINLYLEINLSIEQSFNTITSRDIMKLWNSPEAFSL